MPSLAIDKAIEKLDVLVGEKLQVRGREPRAVPACLFLRCCAARSFRFCKDAWCVRQGRGGPCGLPLSSSSKTFVQLLQAATFLPVECLASGVSALVGTLWMWK